MSERIVDRPGLATAGEQAAWSSLRDRIAITLRPLGVPTPIGFLGPGGRVAGADRVRVRGAGLVVLPLCRRGKGEIAVRGSLLEQVGEVVHEPGVRQQL